MSESRAKVIKKRGEIISHWLRSTTNHFDTNENKIKSEEELNKQKAIQEFDQALTNYLVKHRPKCLPVKKKHAAASLYKLYKWVNGAGGYQSITERKLWLRVRLSCFPEQKWTGNKVKGIYEKILLDFAEKNKKKTESTCQKKEKPINSGSVQEQNMEKLKEPVLSSLVAEKSSSIDIRMDRVEMAPFKKPSKLAWKVICRSLNTASTRIHCEDCDGENKENKVKKENSHKGTVNVEPVSPASQNPQLRDGTDTERFPLVTTATQTSPVRKLLIDQSDSGAIQLAFDPDVKFWAASEYFDVGFSRRTESTSIPKPTSVPLVKQPKSETHGYSLNLQWCLMPVSLATGLLSDTVRQQSASPDANYSGGMADPFWHSRSQSAYACTDDGAQLLSYPNPQFIQPMTIPTPQAFHIAGVGQMRPQFCQGSSRDLLSQPRGFL